MINIQALTSFKTCDMEGQDKLKSYFLGSFKPYITNSLKKFYININI